MGGWDTQLASVLHQSEHLLFQETQVSFTIHHIYDNLKLEYHPFLVHIFNLLFVSLRARLKILAFNIDNLTQVSSLT